MARLTALPSLDIIHGLKGVLDFYLWKGLPCVRRWPRMTKAQQTQGTIAASAIFGEISTAYRTLAPLELAALQEAAKDQPRTARDLYMSAAYGHLHQVAEPPAPPPPEEQMYDAYVCLRDLKPQNTPGGDFVQDAWQTRDLNDEQADTADICTLAANQITLPAGSYRCAISCPALRVWVHQTRLYNVTGAAVLLLGTSEYAHDGEYQTNHSHLNGRFTLAAETVLQIQHRCFQTKTVDGFGRNANFADEIYTVAEFWREVPPA